MGEVAYRCGGLDKDGIGWVGVGQVGMGWGGAKRRGRIAMVNN